MSKYGYTINAYFIETKTGKPIIFDIFKQKFVYKNTHTGYYISLEQAMYWVKRHTKPQNLQVVFHGYKNKELVTQIIY